MALSAYVTWSAGDILTAADQNGSFNNILNNALSLISPLTGNLNCNTRQLTNLLLEVQASSQTAANEGRIYWQSTEDQIHVDDGTNQRRVPAIASVARGGIIAASATGQWAQLALGAAGTILRSDGTDLVYSTATYPTTVTTGALIAATGTNAVGSIAAVAAGSFLRAAGTGTLPAWSTTTVPDTGTSGGVLAYTATGTLASSAALTANGVVYGGGAGAAPSSTAQGGTNTVLIASAGAPSFSAAPIVNTSVQVGVASTTTGSLILANSASASLTTLRAGNATEANTYVLPTDGGGASQVLTTDGATPTTTLSWSTVTSGAESGTWTTDLSATRNDGIVYQNTSGKKRRVWTTFEGGNNAALNCHVLVGSVNPPTTVDNYYTINVAASGKHVLARYFEVPSNWYYESVLVTGARSTWTELDE